MDIVETNYTCDEAMQSLFQASYHVGKGLIPNFKFHDF